MTRIASGRARSVEHRGGGLRPLLGLVVFSGALGYLLWRVDGPPRPPVGLFDIDRVREILTSSQIADGDVITIAATIGWLALGYLALTILLRLLVAAAERVLGAPRWLRGAARASDLITLPLVRHIVDGAVTGTLLLATVLPSAATARAVAPAYVPVATASYTRPWTVEAAIGSGAHDNRPAHQEESLPRHVSYTVVRGDYLWAIAHRFYGDGSRWPEIFEANRGRLMPGGARFLDPNLIHPGWVLVIPLPARHLTVRPDGAVAYEVRPGDSLWRIAERLLGDGFRWGEIWELNARREMERGRRFVNPDLIYPGWWLELPLSAGYSGVDEEVEVPRGSPATEPTTAPARPAPTNGASPVPAAPSTRSPESDPDRDHGWDLPAVSLPTIPRPILFTAAGFAVLGGAVVVVQRLRGAGALGWPRARLGPRGGLGDAGRVTAAARALAVTLDEFGFGDARTLVVAESPDALEFTVACAPGDADALADAQYDLARRLACEVDAEVVGSTRVVIRLSGFQRLAGLLVESRIERPPLLVPIGADEDEIVYLDLATAGSTAVVGEASERRRLLRSWLATLRTTARAEEAVVRWDTETAAFLGIGAGDAADGAPRNPAEFAGELDEMILARGEEQTGARALVALLDVADGDTERLGSVLHHGLRVGVFTVCGATDAPPRASDFAAVVRLGHRGDDGEPADEEATSGGVELVLPGGETLNLEPVRVRVEESPHWQWEEPFAGSADGAATEERGGGPIGVAPQLEEQEALEDAAVDDPTGDSLRDAIDGDVEEGARPEDDSPPVGLRTSAAATEPAARTEVETHEPGEAEERPGPVPVTAAPRQAEAASSSSSVATRQPTLLLDDPEAKPLQAAVPTFTVRCLGAFEVECDGRVIDQWRLQKGRELLALLVARGGGSVGREVIVEALWPDDDPQRTAQLLHSSAHYLRRALRDASGDPAGQFVVVSSQQYRLEPGRFRTDLDRFDAHLRRAQMREGTEALDEVERALELYRGEFMEGEPFEWTEAYRHDYAARFQTIARAAAAEARASGEIERARSLYQRALERDATDEEAVRGLMRVYVAAGNPSGAHKAYRALVEALRRELDDEEAEPAPETTSLLEEIVGRTAGS